MVLTQFFDQFFAGKLMMHSNLGKDSRQGTDFQRVMGGHCDVVLAVQLGGQLNMAAALARIS